MSFAFVFPGQGSQSVGMLAELAAAEPLVRETFAEASEVLGYDLWALCAEGPQELLSTTERTQPAMLTAGVATWRVWRKHGGGLPVAVAGHSLGEYSALVCAGALEFRDAVALVQLRGQAMQAAMPSGTVGAMAAILGLQDADVEAVCSEVANGDVVQPANYNSPGQIVIAGAAAAVDRAIQAAQARGAKRAIKLPISVACHSTLMQPAAARLADKLQATPFTTPQVRNIYTVDVRLHGGPEEMRAALVEQLVKPVRWTETVQAMVASGVRTIVECGPGRVLTGLNRRIERSKDITMLAIDDPASLQQALDLCKAST